MEIENSILELINSYNEKEDWKGMQKILRPFVKNKTSNYLYFINYAIALYYDYKYNEALISSEKAFQKNDKDPFVLYHHGIILMVNKRFNDSLKIFKRIISIPKHRLYFGEFGGGKRWGDSLTIDVLYYIAKTYFYKNDLANSIKYYNIHLQKRKRGTASFVSKKEVLKELNEVVFLQEYERKYPEKAKKIL